MQDELIAFLPDEELTADESMIVSSLSESYDWGLEAEGVPDAHKYTRGAGVTVAVLDTGVCPTHPDLQVNLILPGRNMTTSPDFIDRQGHGSHVSGIIAAAKNDTGIIGVAPEARILPIKVLDDRAKGSYTWIEAGIREAISAGVDIINMSLGAPSAPPDSLHEAIKEAVAKGIIVIAAAGNDGRAVNYPACYDEVIAVGAIDQDGKLASFSSRGDRLDIGAPGVNVYSCYKDDQYAILQGTSQAAPFISGVAALIISHSRSSADDTPVTGSQDLLKRLDSLADQQGRIGFYTKSNGIGVGVPQFCNTMPWKA